MYSAFVRVLQRLLTDVLKLPGFHMDKPTDFVPSLYSDETEDRIPALHELEDVEHLMVKIAHQFEALLKQTLVLKDVDFDQMATDPNIDPTLRSFIRKPRVRLAQMFVQNYWKGNMPLVNDIIYTKLPSAFIDIVPKLREFTVDAESRAKLDEMWRSLVLKLPTPVKRMTADAVEHEGDWPPPLPPIHNEQILQQVFTHRSACGPEQYAKSERALMHNERLEFKGDRVLDAVMCDLLFDRFPTANEGQLSHHKSSLVRNSILCHISVLYGLPARLNAAKSVLDIIERSPDSKVVADIFEAYIGGLELDQGYDVCEKWLHKLYEPFIQHLQKGGVTEIDRKAKTTLYRLIGSEEQKIDYVQMESSENRYVVACCVNDDILGLGEDKNLKDAGLRAAMEALRNHAMIEKYSCIRREARPPKKKKLEKPKNENVSDEDGERATPNPDEITKDSSVEV